jgi:hypothetical protein
MLSPYSTDLLPLLFLDRAFPGESGWCKVMFAIQFVHFRVGRKFSAGQVTLRITLARRLCLAPLHKCGRHLPESFCLHHQ